MVGLQVVKFAGRNYETIRDDAGANTAALIGLAGIAMFLLSGISLIRWVLKSRTAARDTAPRGYAITDDYSDRDVHKTGKIFYTLLGVLLGAVSCLLMFMAAATTAFGTEAAERFATSARAIAFLMVITSALFGIVGLFRWREGMWRVPVYFIFSGCLTYAMVWLSGMNFRTWQPFVEMLR